MPIKNSDNPVLKSMPADRPNFLEGHTTAARGDTDEEWASSAACRNANGDRNTTDRNTVDVRTTSRISPRLRFGLERKAYDKLTVLIPGTWAPLLGPLPAWYSPSPRPRTLHAYLKETVFPDEAIFVYRWNRWGLTAAARHQQRIAAARQLLEILRSIRVKSLRIVGHSHGANVASMATRNDLVPGRRGLHVDTLVLLNPAVDRDGKCGMYHPDMNRVGDLSVPLEERRFFTFHSVRDATLASQWAQNYQHTELGRYETLRDNIAPDDHWSSTFPEVWRHNRLDQLIRTA
jgi:hypothetical protein